MNKITTMEHMYWIEVPQKGYVSELFHCDTITDIKHKSKRILLENVDFHKTITYNVRSINRVFQIQCIKCNKYGSTKILREFECDNPVRQMDRELNALFYMYLDNHEDISRIDGFLQRYKCNQALNERCNVEFNAIEERFEQLREFRGLIADYLSNDYIRVVDFFTRFIHEYKHYNIGDNQIIASIIGMRQRHYTISQNLRDLVQDLDNRIEELHNRHKRVCDIVLLMVNNDNAL